MSEMIDAGAGAEPPKPDAEGDAALLSRLGGDASKWAAEFRRTAVRLGYSDMDEGWLISWFANAIEHSESVRRAAAPAPAGDEVERVAAAIEKSYYEEDHDDAYVVADGRLSWRVMARAALAAMPERDSTGWSRISRAARNVTGLDQEALADIYNDWIASLLDEDQNPHQFKAFLAGVALVAPAAETRGLMRAAEIVLKADEHYDWIAKRIRTEAAAAQPAAQPDLAAAERERLHRLMWAHVLKLPVKQRAAWIEPMAVVKRGRFLTGDEKITNLARGLEMDRGELVDCLRAVPDALEKAPEVPAEPAHPAPEPPAEVEWPSNDILADLVGDLHRGENLPAHKALELVRLINDARAALARRPDPIVHLFGSTDDATSRLVTARCGATVSVTSAVTKKEHVTCMLCLRKDGVRPDPTPATPVIDETRDDSISLRILGRVKGCRECPHRVYYSGGCYNCAEADRVLPYPTPDHGMPAWCPLELFPIPKQIAEHDAVAARCPGGWREGWIAGRDAAAEVADIKIGVDCLRHPRARPAGRERGRVRWLKLF